MARIFITGAQEDFEILQLIRMELMEDGHDLIQSDYMEPGKQWVEELKKEIWHADVVIALFSKHSMRSKWLDREFSMLRGITSSHDENKLFLPVVIGEFADIPHDIAHYQFINLPDAGMSEIRNAIPVIKRAIDRFSGRLSASKEELKEERARVEAKASSFMSEAMTSLNAREEKFSKKASWWYGLGYTSLLIGVVISACFAFISVKSDTDGDWAIAVVWGIKSILMLGLLVALSKYAFTLGKSHMTEALKNADRKHAISFGNFFMEAFAESIKPEDVKEVFQDWNMADGNSGFDKCTASDFDPKIIEQFTKFVESIKK